MDIFEPDVLDEILLPSARGGVRAGRIAQAVHVRIVRELTEADIPQLTAAALPVATGPRDVVQQLRHHHHRIAQLIAKGTSHEEVSYLTGYSPSWISSLSAGPEFQDLIAYYAKQETEVLLDATERLKNVGIKAVEELDARLELEPEKFTKQELMEVADLGIVKPLRAAQKALDKAPGANIPGGINIAVSFVSAKAKGEGGPEIEGRIVTQLPGGEE